MTIPHDPSHDDLLASYALDAVGAADRLTVEAHLTDCADCRITVSEFREVASRLAPEVRPHDAVWGRILAEIGPAAAASARVVPMPSATPTAAGPRLLAVAAGILLVFGLAVGRLTVGETDPDLAQLAANIAADPSTQPVSLLTTDGVHAADVVLAGSGVAFVIADELPPLPENQTYQLWAMQGGQPVSIGVLGNAPTVVPVGAPAHFDALAISVEPATGSPAPTSTPIALG